MGLAKTTVLHMAFKVVCTVWMSVTDQRCGAVAKGMAACAEQPGGGFVASVLIAVTRPFQSVRCSTTVAGITDS
jgi:hypothetical protein